MKFIFVTIRIFADYLYASDQGRVVESPIKLTQG